MTPSDLEAEATRKARTVDPSVFPYPTSASEWRTWVGTQGQWMQIEKPAIAVIADAFGFDKEQAFQWMGHKMLHWLSKNSAKVKPRAEWKITFAENKDIPLHFGIWNNQCFLYLPRSGS